MSLIVSYQFLFSYHSNLQEDVNVLKQEEDRIKQNLRHLTSQIQNNECQLRSEESKLTGIRRDATSVTEKIRTLETEKEPEPTDVLALVNARFRIKKGKIN